MAFRSPGSWNFSDHPCEDGFGGHERQLLVDPLLDNFFVHHEPFGDILQCCQDDVSGQESFGDCDPSVCSDADLGFIARIVDLKDSRVVECPLKPLHTGCHQNILMQSHQMSRETADPLRAHRVPLISHRRRTDLISFERLFDFLHPSHQLMSCLRLKQATDFEVSEQPYIGGDLVSRCRK